MESPDFRILKRIGAMNRGIRGARRPPLRQAGRPPLRSHGSWVAATIRESRIGSMNRGRRRDYDED
jgi:hypothetical protein